MKVNYHSHTERCHHAIGKDEEYVQEAIAAGYDQIGFSDHMPVPGIEKEEEGFQVRMSYSQKENYEKSVESLRQKYRNKIYIYLAYECEYFSELDEYYAELLKRCDYLIFGNHFMHYDGKRIFNKEKELGTDEYIRLYEEKAVRALNSGFFSIMAHPDLYLKYCAWSPRARLCAERICRAAKKNNVALEINEMCFRRDGKTKIGNEFRYGYPTKYFFEIAKEIGNRVIVGVDAHAPKDYRSGSHEMALAFARDLGIEIEESL